MYGKYEKSKPGSPRRRLSLSQRLSIPFLTVLFVMSVVSFILPLRPTQSLVEKRTLTRFPEFSVRALMSSEYFSQINLWYSDTFPGREGFISVSHDIDKLHGIYKNQIHTDANVNMQQDNALLDELTSAVPTATPAPAASAAPTATPAPTKEAQGSVEEAWRGFGADDEIAMFGNTVMLDDTILVMMNFSQDASDQHIALCNSLGDKLAEKNIRFFNIPVPTSVGILVDPDFLPQIGCADQEKMLKYMFDRENDNVYKVNAFKRLHDHNREYIYFRGDHHWTALGAYYTYEDFCEQAGFDAVPLDDYERIDMGVFKGTTYLQAGYPPKAVDEMIAYVPPGELSMVVPDYPKITLPVRDMSDSDEFSKYNCFIGGDNGPTVITNASIKDNSCCVVLKDSFGNPFTVYLTQHYNKVSCWTTATSTTT